MSGGQDLNLRPLPPQGSALPGCATARKKSGQKNNKNIQIGIAKIEIMQSKRTGIVLLKTPKPSKNPQR